MTAAFSISFLPLGIQTANGVDVVVAFTDVPFSNTAVTLADIASAEVGPRMEGAKGVVTPGDGEWVLLLDSASSVTLTDDALGIWVAIDGGTDADSPLIGGDSVAIPAGPFVPSYDLGFLELPFLPRPPSVLSVVAGDNVTVDATDPQNPIVSATGGGGGGPVTSDDVTVLDGPGGDPVATLTEVDLPGLFARVVVLEEGAGDDPWLDPVRVVQTTGGGSSAGDVIDGVTLANGDRVLRTNDAGVDNKIYVVGGGTTDTEGYRAGTTVKVGPEGTTYGNTEWVITTPDPFDVSIDTITWEQVVGTGGAPSGAAGGDLSGTYPNPTIAANAVGTTEITDAAVTLAKQADLAAATIIGRASGAGTGVPTALSASQVRTAAGLVIGTDVEAHDTDLTTIAGLSPSNDDLLQRKSGAWVNRTPAQVKTDLVLVKGDVGLGNVTNNSQALLSWNPAPTVKASDQSYNSSVVLRDDTALTFAYGAGEVWTGEAILFAYGATGADLAVGIGASTAATLLQAGVVGPASTYAGSAASMQSQGNIVALTTVGGAGFGVFGTGTTAAAGAFVTIKFTFSSASAGTLAIQHCQAVTSATNTVIQAGSSLTMRRSS